MFGYTLWGVYLYKSANTEVFSRTKVQLLTAKALPLQQLPSEWQQGPSLYDVFTSTKVQILTAKALPLHQLPSEWQQGPSLSASLARTRRFGYVFAFYLSPPPPRPRICCALGGAWGRAVCHAEVRAQIGCGCACMRNANACRQNANAMQNAMQNANACRHTRSVGVLACVCILCMYI